ncbi:MAG: H-NS histone family protein [Thiobacillaceae bacterium]|nr:H-NS histone family protein [Thiobacillaceae bacterium]MDW8324509.1 H-NS histone family protein [Burkholderiales bacterium]
MSRWKELKDQIAALEREAEKARKEELAAVIADIKAKMAEWGISVEDLGLPTRRRGRRKAAVGEAKYRNPATGETWTGKGRKPAWLTQALAQGKSLDDFRV